MSYQSENLERQRNIAYIKSVSTYADIVFKGKTNQQIYSWRRSIEHAMAEYPKEIAAYYNEHPEIKQGFTLEQLREMNYNDLWKLRKTLGLSKKGKKKVVAVNEDLEASQKAKEAISSRTTTEVAIAVIQNNTELDYEEEKYDDFQFITLSEAITMYGDEITDEELERLGYKLYEPIGRTREESIEKRNLVYSILESEITIKSLPLTEEALMSLDLEDLHYIYYIADKLEKELKEPGRAKRP